MEAKTVVSRRGFLKGLAGAAALQHTGPLILTQAQAPSPREKLSPFHYSDVRLTGGLLKAQFDRVHAAYLALDEDRLLKVYRLRMGLPAPGEDMGGWYEADGFAPGHSFGQYVSGLARFAAATGDRATQAKVRRLVEGFAATVAPDGYCYANLKASTTFPAYILDKHLVALMDAYQYAGSSSALESIERIVKGALRYLPPRAIERDEAPRHVPYDESYTLPENFFYAYELSGNTEYLDLAKRFLSDRGYFDPLARGVNVLPGLHAYSHVNALSSGAKAYQVLGERKYLQAIQNAWDMIEKTQQFASGGWGPDEAFVEPNKGKLGESLTRTHAHFETPCGAYAHFKLARYLLRFTAETRYGDGLERVLYNTLLGAKDPQGEGHFFYYSDYHPSGQKGYHPDKWVCCSGTLPQAVADYVISAYFRSEDGIYVNLYVPSEVSWNVQGTPIKLVQSTSYPEAESTELRFELPAPTEFTVHVRVPGWLESPAQLAVNGKAVSVPAERGTFAALRRRWQAKDTIQVKLPFSFRTEPIDEQHRNTVALMRGPIMLVALAPRLTLPRMSGDSPDVLHAAPQRPQTFEVPAPVSSVRFVPFYAVEDEVYTTYLTQV